MSKYDYLFFDLDGTLTDPGEGITNSVIYALKKWGIEVCDRRELYAFIGPPLSASFKKYYGFSDSDALKCVEYYREYFRDRGIFENKVYEGISEMLAELKGRGAQVVLATSKPEIFAKQILDHFDLAKYFDFVAGATMDESRNKKADVIAYALECLDVSDKSRVLMIGDRDQDILGARTNGIDSLGVLYGYGDLAELSSAGATHIAEKVSDILKHA
ncbi:MAG: HAD family hydrolase [Clostridia bacterium]|nr:HAD family hydrolase [Clostridia bacterium]